MSCDGWESLVTVIYETFFVSLLITMVFFFTTATKKNLYNVTKSKSYLDNYTSLDLKPPSVPLGELKSPFIK